MPTLRHWWEGGYLFKVVENSLLRIWLTQKCTYAMWMSCGLRADLQVRGNVSENESTDICRIILTKHMLFKKKFLACDINYGDISLWTLPRLACAIARHS